MIKLTNRWLNDFRIGTKLVYCHQPDKDYQFIYQISCSRYAHIKENDEGETFYDKTV